MAPRHDMTNLPKLVPDGGGDVFTAFGDRLTVKLSGGQTGGAFALCDCVTPPGGGPPPHFHLNEDEVFIVQEGTVEFWVDGLWHRLEAGGVVYAPKGKVHTFRNAGTVPCRQWIFATPAGFETFFARCAAEFAKPQGPDMQRILEISAEHGIHYVDPAKAQS